MAQNLVASGHQVIHYDVSESCLSAVEGGKRAGSPAEVAESCSIVITMLPSGVNVLQCYSGEGGVLRCVSVGACVCVCACVRACVYVCLSVSVCVCVCMYTLVHTFPPPPQWCPARLPAGGLQYYRPRGRPGCGQTQPGPPSRIH